MNLHGISKSSRVNGPGKRFVIWTQGCSKGCKNCFNPATWNFEPNLILDVKEIFELIKESNVRGVTISGGDPLEQPDELLELLKLLKELDLSSGIILFSGFTWDEINNIGGSTLECLDYVDLLIDGKFEEELKTDIGIRGSSNQNYIYFSSKINAAEVEFDRAIEIGDSFITGFPILDKSYLKEFGIRLI
jgi:anaerobic ribonucleoside-triphosphate reductase activating protein